MRLAKTIVLPIAIIGLSGCQSFASLLGFQDRPVTTTADASSYFVQLLEEGRLHIRASRPGSAITAFRQASYHPAYAGEAYNGMAVAYDMMGRYDLAERFFRAAVQEAPEDPRFARNYSRFENLMIARGGIDNGTQMASSPVGEELLAVSGEVEPIETGELTLAVSELPQRMQRVSSHEVAISGRDDWVARVASADAARQAIVHLDSSENRQNLAERELPQYPVRIDLADVPQGEETSIGGSGVPVTSMGLVNEQGEPSVRVSGTLVRRESPAYPVRIALDRR